MFSPAAWTANLLTVSDTIDFKNKNESPAFDNKFMILLISLYHTFKFNCFLVYSVLAFWSFTSNIVLHLSFYASLYRCITDVL